MKISNEGNIIRDIAKEGYKAIDKVISNVAPDEEPDFNSAHKIGDSYLKSIAASKSAGIIEKTVAKSAKATFNDSTVKAQETTLKAISHGLPPTLSSAIAQVGIKILNTVPHYNSYEPDGANYEDLKTMGKSFLNDIEEKSKDSYAKEMAKSAKEAVKNMDNYSAVQHMEDVFGKIAKHK